MLKNFLENEVKDKYQIMSRYDHCKNVMIFRVYKDGHFVEKAIEFESAFYNYMLAEFDIVQILRSMIKKLDKELEESKNA